MAETYAHSVIRNDLLEITPIEISLAKSKLTDENTIAGCRAFYEFNINLLTDMLANPEQYLIYPGEYETLMENQPRFAGARWHDAVDETTPQKLENSRSYSREERKKFHDYECNARNKTNYAISFYRSYLFHVCTHGELQDGRFVIKKDDYAKAVKGFGGAKYFKKKDMPARLQAFAHVGLVISEDENQVVFEYPEDKNMLPVMAEMSRQAEKNKDYGKFNFMWCNFGQLTEKYKPNFEDVIRILSPDNRKSAEELNNYAKSMKISPKPYLPWKLSYNYKGQVVFRTYANNGNLNITAIHCVDCKDIEIFARQLENESVEPKDFCIKHLNHCIDCGQCHNPPGENGVPIKLLGKDYRVCGWYAGGLIDNPSDTDVEMIKEFIRMRKDFIDILKSK